MRAFTFRQAAWVTGIVVSLGGAAAACGLDASGLQGTGALDASAPGSDSGAPIAHDAGGPILPTDSGHPISPSGDSSVPIGTNDASVEPDTGAPPPPPPADACLPTETCGNGVDDDCNGLVDCADPACGAWSCDGSGAIPAGWTVVAFSQKASGACAIGYTTPTPLYDGTFPPAGCKCESAVATPGSCVGGTIEITGGDPGCLGYDAGVPTPGACVAFGQGHAFTPPIGSDIAVTAAPYTAGSCSATPTATIPPITPSAQACAIAGGPGGGCSNGGVCVPTLAGDAKTCIAHDGDVACPPGIGFNSQQTFDRTVTDSRGCTPCTSTGPTATCNNPQLTFFTDSACTTGPAVVNANGLCLAFPPSPMPGASYQSDRYAATVQNESCAASPVTPMGDVTLSDPVTYCCR